MIGCTTSSTALPEANGEAQSTYQLGIDLLGIKSDVLVDSQGRLKAKVDLSSADGRVSLSLNEDTISLNEEGGHLQAITVAIDPNPPPPPDDANIVGAVYDFRPEGAHFNPFIMLTLSYSPEELPEGAKESDVYIGYYQNTEWNMLRYKNIDAENHRVTTQIDHFARYAVLAPREHLTSGTPSAPADRVEVVYFYRTPQCYSCIYAETGTRYTVETYFKDELANGKVTFETFNVEDKENAPIIKKYGAFTSSLFINTVRGGSDHIEAVMDIWFVLGDDEAFIKMEKDKIEGSLKETR